MSIAGNYHWDRSTYIKKGREVEKEQREGRREGEDREKEKEGVMGETEREKKEKEGERCGRETEREKKRKIKIAR